MRANKKNNRVNILVSQKGKLQVERQETCFF